MCGPNVFWKPEIKISGPSFKLFSRKRPLNTIMVFVMDPKIMIYEVVEWFLPIVLSTEVFFCITVFFQVNKGSKKKTKIVLKVSLKNISFKKVKHLLGSFTFKFVQIPIVSKINNLFAAKIVQLYFKISFHE